MVKVSTKTRETKSKLVTRAKTFKFTKKRLLFIGLIFAIIAALTLVALFVRQQATEPELSCIDANLQYKDSFLKTVNDPNATDMYQKLYEDVNSRTSSCDRSTKAFGVVGPESTESKLQKLQFYYDKATVSYSIGKMDEAKEDARKGLDANSGLSSSEKTLENHGLLVKALENIRDGTY